MQIFKLLVPAFYFLMISIAFNCKPKKYIYKSPPHYNFAQPVRFELDVAIREISGLIWDNQKDQFVAHNDEKGQVYFLDRSAGTIMGQPFVFSPSKGDYEDIAMIGQDIYVLRSDGAIFKIGIDSSGQRNSTDLGKIGLSDKNDFEAIYYDAEKKALIMICKNCNSDDKKTVSAFAYYPDSIGFVTKPLYQIDAAKIKQLSPRETSKFQPSAARIHPVLKKLFIISSASNQLVVADSNGEVEAVYMLAKKLFPQPEGLTFKSNGEMWICNEGVASGGTLVKFLYTP
ncbi:MAG TPA: SdiA-regulated domain-containing protein [Chitinophagaceae bacterium]|nr:SdiA-regulated domain-containing protein [Chitinophagaceae bacterium]